MHASASSDAERTGRGPEPRTQRPAVLIVDDEASVCWAIRDALDGTGAYATAVASCAAAARRIVSTRAIDVVLTDVRMPAESGLNLLSWMRREHPLVPVVVMTALGGAEGTAAIINNGAASLLPKPIDLSLLLEVVAHAARSRGGAL
jgi:two-component system nitrogen regulation response regulator GlnG